MSKQRMADAIKARSPLVQREAVAPADLYQTDAANPESPTVGNQEKAKSGNTEHLQADEPQRVRPEKYSTLLRPATIKAIKRLALERDAKDYAIVQAALDTYLAQQPESGFSGKPEQRLI